MKTRVFENMNDLKNNRRGGHIKNNDISFVKENNSIIIGDNNISNSILYPPILTLTRIDENYLFTEDIKLLIQLENNLEEILKYCLIGVGITGENALFFCISPFKLTKNIEEKGIVPDYENYYYLVSVENVRKPGDEYYSISYLEISKLFPYTIKTAAL